MIDRRVDIRRVPCIDHDLVIGDMNAHSPTWDSSVTTPVRRGDVFENWIVIKDMAVFNRGDPVYSNRKEGERQTAPDMSIAHISMLDKLS